MSKAIIKTEKGDMTVQFYDKDAPNTVANFLKLAKSGYYDGACTYFDAKYSMWNMDPSGRFKNRLRFEGYRSGHMMYLRREDLEKSNEDFRDFILKSLPAKGVPAKY